MAILLWLSLANNQSGLDFALKSKKIVRFSILKSLILDFLRVNPQSPPWIKVSGGFWCHRIITDRDDFISSLFLSDPFYSTAAL